MGRPRPRWRRAHPALVSEQDFVAVQAIAATPRPDTDEARTYLLAGLLRCGLCGRLLDSHWVYRSPGYRCRHGHTSHRPDPDRPKNIYIRQDAAINYAAVHLGIPFDAPEQVVEQLRATGSTIICRPTDMIFQGPRTRSRCQRTRETL